MADEFPETGLDTPSADSTSMVRIGSQLLGVVDVRRQKNPHENPRRCGWKTERQRG